MKSALASVATVAFACLPLRAMAQTEPPSEDGATPAATSPAPPTAPPPSPPPAPSTGMKIAHGAGDLGAREWTTYYQGVSAQPVPTIPILHLGSLISGSVVLVKTGDVKRPSFIAAGVGLVASLAALVVTFAITAPNVSEVDGWDPNNPPADWEGYRRRIRTADVLRTILSGTAMAANITSLALEW